ncbi:MAG TPA: sodium:proton exchanger [Anaerolineae bacterium]|nr:sodium:proton exchanger [Anaerolineae bacterium]
MEHESQILITIVAAVGFGLIAQVLAHRWRIPAIVLLLISGILLGPDVFHIIEPHELGEGLEILVKLAVAVILFEGALNLRLKTLRHAVAEVRNLVTVGVLVAWGLTSLIAHYIAQLDWPLAILFGALLTVTGPTVVQPLLKRIHVSKRIKTILEGEAILIDPIGAILAVAVLDVVLQLYTNAAIGIWSALWGYFGRLVIGTIVGGAGALILGRMMRVPRLIPPEISNLVALATVWASFGIAESIRSEAGIMSSVAMGLVLQLEAIPGERQLRHFKESLTTLSISVLFVLLAANLSLDSVLSEGYQGILAVLMIMLIARPISVLISTRGTRLNLREKLFISWVGPRGIVAASVASLFAFTLLGIGVDDGERLLALTFLAIVMTVTIQGLSASFVSRLLGVETLEGKKAIIVGAGLFGRTIAKSLNENGRPAVLVDTNHTMVEIAQREGLEAIFGNALEDEVLERTNIEEAETVLAITTNSEVNVLVSQIAHDHFGIRLAYPSLKNPEKGTNEELLKKTAGKLAFGRPIDILKWEYSSGKINSILWLVPENWTNKMISDVLTPHELVPVIRITKRNTEVVHADQIWLPGDKIIFLSNVSNELTEDLLKSLA